MSEVTSRRLLPILRKASRWLAGVRTAALHRCGEEPMGEIDDELETGRAEGANPEPVTQATIAVEMDSIEVDAPRVGIIMGSKSDMDVMDGAAKVLREANVRHEVRVMSAHREPELVSEYCRNARMRGLQVIIAGAGLSAALPGVAAAHTDLPVIGVPLSSRLSAMGGLDAILSVLQMPPGVPVAGVGLDNAKNAGALALRILGA